MEVGAVCRYRPIDVGNSADNSKTKPCIFS
jgi:hypothetical protein